MCLLIQRNTKIDVQSVDAFAVFAIIEQPPPLPRENVLFSISFAEKIGSLKKEFATKVHEGKKS